jgi:hypothetical protein
MSVDGLDCMIDRAYGWFDLSKELFARLARKNAPRGSVEQPNAQPGFESCDRLAESSGRNAEVGRRGAETSSPGDGHGRLKLHDPDFPHYPDSCITS